MPKTKYKTFTPGEKPESLRDKVFSITLLIVVAVMPLIVRHTVVTAAPELVELLRWTQSDDFFAHYKGWTLGIAAIIMAFYAVADWVIGGATKDKFIAFIKYPPIAAACVFLLMALVSTIFSSYRHTSWNGSIERSEGLFILFAYFIVFFAAMHHVRKDKHAKLLMYGLAFSSIIMGLIGLSQFMGRDFFTTSLGTRLIMGEWGLGVNQRFTRAYGTLYNPNPFGKYTAMVAPVMLACAMAYDGRKWMRVVFFAGGMLMLVGVVASVSVGGLIGIAVAVMVTVLALACRFFYQLRLRSKEKENGGEPVARRNIAMWFISGAIIAAVLVGLLFVPAVNREIRFLVGRLENAIRREPTPTYNYIFDGGSMTVLWQDEEKFTFVLLEDEYGPDNVLWRLYDASGQPIPLLGRTQPSPDITVFEYRVPGHRRLEIQRFDIEDAYIIDYFGFDVTIMVHNMAMVLYDGRIHAVLRNLQLADVSIPIPAIGFYGNETWGSSRGHIWSRTFPLMPAHAIIGSGPDTYTFVFPQHDVIGKMRFHEHPTVPIDKAHNLFLHTWVTTGGISVLALMFLFGYYLFTTFVSIVRSRMKEGVFIFGLRFGLLAGISAYCVAAMSTDSTIGSSGVFYLLLGLGFGVNLMVEKVYKEVEPEKVHH